ncbi:MAG: CapA family protein, partial [Oscillospiraceae bacterium]
FGKSLLVLKYEYKEVQSNSIHLAENQTTRPITLAFTGDINLADTWENMQVYYAQENGIFDCISEGLRNKMQQADILLVNNEFSYSNRGQPMPGKQYTFRAKTENVEIMQQLGVDIVSLANNHVFDYGEDAFYDTLETLQKSGIPYVGAGKNIEEAMQPQYFIVGGIKIAYVAASRAEKYILTPEATETTPGILRTYNPAQFLQVTETAKRNADIVIAYPHWGTENTSVLEKEQIELAHQLVDAGADLVIGAHPHCLQGVEYYNEKPIIYSLGNFWFNTATVDTALLEISLQSPDEIIVRMLPCIQRGGKTFLLENASEKEKIWTFLESISPGISFDNNGKMFATIQ